jgi:peptidoglycan/xylan/chitin deacetylase (PgdA/CDA1 family)
MVILAFLEKGVKVMGPLAFGLCLAASAVSQQSFVRLNQVGFLPGDTKTAVVISRGALPPRYSLVNAAGNRVVMTGDLKELTPGAWGGQFDRFYLADFSQIKGAGRYHLNVDSGNVVSSDFSIGPYPAYQEDLLLFLRQQRCGYNPYLGTYCHQHDGKTVYGPMPDGTVIDATGGWHDAGDQLKYLITASNATARMLLAYELEKRKFTDTVDALGNTKPNGVPDVLDEAKWGLDWIFKLHPAPDQLFHQVADDRDHRGFRLPQNDPADYGWGPNSYRPVYFADGKPQGLRNWKSQATGIANLAGRSAAAMAMAYRIWKNDLHDDIYAAKCLQAALELYSMGRQHEGYQQGNSFGAPYRYNEDTWADDMEWAAAELYKALKTPSYLADAKRYAQLAGATSWMQYDSSDMGPQMSRHYERYPFTNIGHYSLYGIADAKTKRELLRYYREGLDRILARGRSNPYNVGVPFLWCSNNLVVAYVTEAMLYERMSGDRRYHDAMIEHRDWLFGRNPWGTSMFTMIPRHGKYPQDVHLPVVQILKREVPGGLVDGPIDSKTYSALIGLKLNQPDEFAEFQTEQVVYHDDVGDYSTNEPTMDGTADAILMMAALSKTLANTSTPRKQTKENTSFTYDQGAIVRGRQNRKRLAIVFTGDEFGDGLPTIVKTLESSKATASFFFTGRFYRHPAFADGIRRLVRDGNFLGPHSNAHLLYADWNNRSKTLVTHGEFVNDLTENYAAMKRFGISKTKAKFFLPPFEWHNNDIAKWAKSFGLTLINFTPGSRSNADYTTPDMAAYRTSQEIFDSIKAYEAEDPEGLNGFLLLIHAGTDPARTDKFYDRLDELIKWLRGKGYSFVTVDRLLDAK